jgi:hypothetical protein
MSSIGVSAMDTETPRNFVHEGLVIEADLNTAGRVARTFLDDYTQSVADKLHDVASGQSLAEILRDDRESGGCEVELGHVCSLLQGERVIIRRNKVFELSPAEVDAVVGPMRDVLKKVVAALVEFGRFNQWAGF